MARLKVLSGSEVVAILREHGYSEARQKGSHLSLQRRESGTTITVVVPMHRELRFGTLASIIRQSRLDRSLFEV